MASTTEPTFKAQALSVIFRDNPRQNNLRMKIVPLQLRSKGGGAFYGTILWEANNYPFPPDRKVDSSDRHFAHPT